MQGRSTDYGMTYDKNISVGNGRYCRGSKRKGKNNYGKNEIYEDSSISYSNKNKAIISQLYDRGIFQIKDSVQKLQMS